MADEQTGRNGRVERTLVFVGGSAEDQEEQKAKIDHDNSGPYPRPFRFFSDWEEMERNLRDGRDCVVVTDLSVIPGDCVEVADRLSRCIQRRIIVYPLNDKQRALLKSRRYFHLSSAALKGHESRIREVLTQLCQNGWQEAEVKRGGKE